MSIPSTVVSRLAQVRGQQKLVQICREAQACPEIGFVSAINKEFVVMSLITDDLRIDGLSVFPLGSIRKVTFLRKDHLFYHALRHYGLSPWAADDLRLENWEMVLKSAAQVWTVLTCSFENRYPGLCYIGSLAGVAHGKVKMRLIDPEGKPVEKVAVFAQEDLTQVQVGGRYEGLLRALIQGHGA